MTTYFVSRHPGCVEWARLQGVQVDAWLPHLDLCQVQPGDTVIGTLPVHLVAEVCRRQAAYVHFSVDLPCHMRGVELDASQLQLLGATLRRFEVQPVS
ncbi:CRISPR-associated protein Csx16 [uncultured Azohydromonas sp.]|uniref:CRISPR-associated protein Csx16 n=1 Tax=uncultured Azohydromonas sp. TaxID=487342 RepID=UPI00262DAE5C|nr:CRISPR-associated protein Csx16 [uncultured Azohydromonas sp.]